MNNVSKFDEDGYIFIKGLIDPDTISIISQYLENKIKRGEWVEGSEGPGHTSNYFYYADPLIETVLLRCKDHIETVVCKELLPTYSYSRIYQPGEALRPHIDRDSCEYSVTVSVAYKGENSPLYMHYKYNEPSKFLLEPGDGVVYKGREAIHWRQPLKKEQLVIQFMLHYVDKNGEFSNLLFDKRSSLGFNQLKVDNAVRNI